MFYYEIKEREGKVPGIIAAIGYIALWIVLMLAVDFTHEKRDMTGEGILVDFGDGDQGAGAAELSDSEISEASSASGSIPGIEPDQMLTQDHEDAPAVSQSRQDQRQATAQTPVNTPNTPPAQSERPREVNRLALFPGSTAGGTSASEGSTQGSGNQGSPDGTPGGSHDGTGAGAGGTGFSLAGRSVLGALVKPQYGPRKSGRIVIDIIVDASGKVTGAEYRPQGSNSNDAELVTAAKRAAMQSKFNAVEGDDLQRGTITYNFILK